MDSNKNHSINVLIVRKKLRLSVILLFNRKGKRLTDDAEKTTMVNALFASSLP